MSTRNEQLTDVLHVLFKHRKFIRNITILAAVGSIIISLLLPNYYKSATTFYPASPELSSPEQIFATTGTKTEYFGNEHDLDRLLEIANGEEVTNFIIDSFQLYKHYEIDSTENEAAYKVRKKFKKLYTVEKNKFDAIEISIEDKDADLCAPIINAARNKVSILAQKLTRQSQVQLMAALEKNIAEKNATVLRLNDSLEHVKNKFGIYEVGAQGQQLAELSTQTRAQVIQLRAVLQSLEADQNVSRDTIAFVRARLKGFEQHLASLKSSDDFSAASYNTGAPIVQVLQDLHFQARKQMSYDIERYTQIKSTFETEIPALHVIQQGNKPLRKHRPTRSLLILVATLGAFVFAALGVLLRESFKEVSWRQISDAH